MSQPQDESVSQLWRGEGAGPVQESLLFNHLSTPSLFTEEKPSVQLNLFDLLQNRKAKKLEREADSRGVTAGDKDTTR